MYTHTPHTHTRIGTAVVVLYKITLAVQNYFCLSEDKVQHCDLTFVREGRRSSHGPCSTFELFMPILITYSKKGEGTGHKNYSDNSDPGDGRRPVIVVCRSESSGDRGKTDLTTVHRSQHSRTGQGTRQDPRMGVGDAKTPLHSQ